MNYDPDAIVPRGDVAGDQFAKTTSKSFKWTMGGQWVTFVVQLVTGALIVRIVGPEVFGIVALATAFAMFADQFKALGLSQAVIQREKLTYGELNTLFWANAAVGGLLAAAMAVLGPLLAVTKSEPMLIPICLLLGISYLFTGFEVQPAALLARQMRFKEISIRNMAARIVASILALVIAYMTKDQPDLLYLGPVMALVLYSVFSAFFIWVAVKWRPTLPRNVSKAKDAIVFGLQIQTGELFNVASRATDYILLSYVAGDVATGLYRRAYDAMMTPIRQIKTPIGSVAQPLMASVRREPDRYSGVYVSVTSGLMHIGAPALVGMIVFATPVVLLYAGDAFLDAVPMLQWLAVAGLVQLASSTCGWLLTTREMSREYIRMSMWAAIFTIVAFIIGVFAGGALGVSVAYAVSQAIMFPVILHYCIQGTDLTLRRIGEALWRPVVVALMVAPPLVIARLISSDWPSWASLLFGMVIGAAAWGAALYFWKAARAEVMAIVGLARKKKASASAQPAAPAPAGPAR